MSAIVLEPRWRPRVLLLVVALAGLGATFAGSFVTGPAFDEERRLAAARRAIDVARAVSDFGPSALVSGSARAIYTELTPFGVLPGLVSGWAGEALRQAGLLDRLTALRFGWLLVTGLAPAAVFLLVQPGAGSRAACVSAALLLSMPRWTHAASAGREGAVVACLWLAVLAAHVRSLPVGVALRKRGFTRRPVLGGVAFGAVLGLALAVHLATAWILPALVLHHAILRGRPAWRAIRRGWVPAPGAALWGIAAAPVVFLVLTPALWHGAADAADFLFASLGSGIEPLRYRGAVVTPKTIPLFYGPHLLAVTVPVGVLGFAFGGAVVGVVARLRGTARPDRSALGALCALVVLGVLFGPALTPGVLSRFPPRVEGALPFLAIAAALGLEALAMRVARRWASLIVAGAALCGLALGGVDMATASASFNLLQGGTRGAIAAGAFTVGDGSEVAVLARSIDALGLARAQVQAADVPKTYWSTLAGLGRMRTPVDVRPQATPGVFVVSRGEARDRIAGASHGGAVVWSLRRR